MSALQKGGMDIGGLKIILHDIQCVIGVKILATENVNVCVVCIVHKVGGYTARLNELDEGESFANPFAEMTDDWFPVGFHMDTIHKCFAKESYDCILMSV